MGRRGVPAEGTLPGEMRKEAPGEEVNLGRRGCLASPRRTQMSARSARLVLRPGLQSLPARELDRPVTQIPPLGSSSSPLTEVHKGLPGTGSCWCGLSPEVSYALEPRSASRVLGVGVGWGLGKGQREAGSFLNSPRLTWGDLSASLLLNTELLCLHLLPQCLLSWNLEGREGLPSPVRVHTLPHRIFWG